MRSWLIQALLTFAFRSGVSVSTPILITGEQTMLSVFHCKLSVSCRRILGLPKGILFCKRGQGGGQRSGLETLLNVPLMFRDTKDPGCSFWQTSSFYFEQIYQAANKFSRTLQSKIGTAVRSCEKGRADWKRERWLLGTTLLPQMSRIQTAWF